MNLGQFCFSQSFFLWIYCLWKRKTSFLVSTYKKDNRLHSLKVWMSPQSIISVITFLVKKDKFFKVVNRTFDPTGSLKQNWPFFSFFFFKFLVLWCKHMYCWNALKWILKLKGRDIQLRIFCKMCFLNNAKNEL